MQRSLTDADLEHTVSTLATLVLGPSSVRPLMDAAWTIAKTEALGTLAGLATASAGSDA